MGRDSERHTSAAGKFKCGKTRVSWDMREIRSSRLFESPGFTETLMEQRTQKIFMEKRAATGK
ncbi:MAG: hypothetical protein J0M04_19230 [Verrucomicrobia bacterium]|nr:hypothetical protein [Verrucomicrobiota bacterium]